MTSLKNLVKAAHAGHHLVVTEPHSQWMELPEEEQYYSDRAVQHVKDALQRKYKVARVGRFSPSGIGKCPRRLAYGYAGAPQVPFDQGSSEIVEHGTWTHLKWQAEGLTMEYMDDVEVWVEDDDLQVGGSMDATLHDGSVFELKSAAPSVFNRQVLSLGEPHDEYLDQLDVYLMLSGSTWASIVYEDRAYGNFHEYRHELTAAREKVLIKLLRRLIRMVEADELPEPFDDCVMRQGKLFKGCPYRKVCHKLNTVSEARAAGGVTDDQVHQFNQTPSKYVWPSQSKEALQ